MEFDMSDEKALQAVAEKVLEMLAPELDNRMVAVKEEVASSIPDQLGEFVHQEGAPKPYSQGTLLEKWLSRKLGTAGGTIGVLGVLIHEMLPQLANLPPMTVLMILGFPTAVAVTYILAQGRIDHTLARNEE